MEHKKLKRIEDYDKVLPIVEVYTAVQSEGSRQGYPTIVIRTTGCTHRCYFGEGGWCDSWYTSIHPEKGQYTFNDIIKMYKDNPHIKEMMLTGGSPTMHPALVNELTHLANEKDIFITIETEGSHFLPTDYPINLLSISPKFSNSIPKIGVATPQGATTDQRMIDRHNKFRLKVDTIADSIMYHRDFHIKPVLDKNLSMVGEVEEFNEQLIDKLLEKGFGASEWTESPTKKEMQNWLPSKIWAMPAGDTRESLQESYPVVMNFVRDRGWRFTGRAHIMAFDTERCV